MRRLVTSQRKQRLTSGKFIRTAIPKSSMEDQAYVCSFLSSFLEAEVQRLARKCGGSEAHQFAHFGHVMGWDGDDDEKHGKDD